MTTRIVRCIIIALIVFCQCSVLYSQDYTLYNMSRIHQSILLNPAYQNQCKVFIGLPVINRIYQNVNNTGFTFDDLFKKGTGIQSDSFLVDLDKLEGKLADKNYFNVESRFSLFALGFWISDYYFTFDLSTKQLTRLVYPKGIISLKNGNASYLGENNPLQFSGLGVKSTVYNEMAFGLSHKFTPELTLGIKIKRLWGIADATPKSTNIEWKTAEDGLETKLIGDIEYNASIPNFSFQLKEDGTVEKVELIEPDDVNASFIQNTFVFPDNTGWALDFGAVYQFDKNISFSASIIDLGYIGWKNNLYNIKTNGIFSVNGLDISRSLRGESVDWGEELSDSLQKTFKFVQTAGSYTTYLNTKIFLGANYALNEKVNFGLMTSSYFYDGSLHQSLTLSANTSPTKWFDASISYSMMNRSYTNLGLGLAFRLWPMQFYFVFDNILTAVNPKTQKNLLTFQFGINLLFGCTKKVDIGLID